MGQESTNWTRQEWRVFNGSNEEFLKYQSTATQGGQRLVQVFYDDKGNVVEAKTFNRKRMNTGFAPKEQFKRQSSGSKSGCGCGCLGCLGSLVKGVVNIISFIIALIVLIFVIILILSYL